MALERFCTFKKRHGPPLFMICSNSVGRLPLIKIREQRRAFGAHSASGFQKDGRTKEAGDTGEVLRFITAPQSGLKALASLTL